MFAEASWAAARAASKESMLLMQGRWKQQKRCSDSVGDSKGQRLVALLIDDWFVWLLLSYRMPKSCEREFCPDAKPGQTSVVANLDEGNDVRL